jgi:LacI family transcriptional regulator
MREKSTIAEVASQAGVAASTVSRVLNGGYASPKVKARVEKIIKQLGYVPSTTARGLKTGRTGCIGVSVESSQGYWFIQLLGGIEEELLQKRISVMLSSLVLRDQYDSSAVQASISEHRFDGLIFIRYTRRERHLLRAARAAQLPVVFIAPDEDLSVGHTVRCCNRDAGVAVAEHLLELGHRRIAYVGGPRDSLDSQDRLRGLRAGLGRAGVSLAREDVTFADNYEAARGTEYADALIKRKRAQLPTAIVLGNDAMALACMRVLLKEGVRIPEDVSVVGFDGVPEGERFWPGLTTAVQPTRLMGQMACRTLLERIQNPVLDEVTRVEYHMQLAVRESTGPAPGAKRQGSNPPPRPSKH